MLVQDSYNAWSVLHEFVTIKMLTAFCAGKKLFFFHPPCRASCTAEGKNKVEIDGNSVRCPFTLHDVYVAIMPQ